MELYIDGVLMTDLLAEEPGSLTYDDILNTRSRLKFKLNDPTNTVVVEIGQEVLYFKDADGVGVEPDFGGTVDTCEDWIDGDKTSTLHRISADCVSFDQKLDRRMAAGYYAAQPVGDLVRTLISEYLGVDGITDGGVVAVGPTVGPFTFNYEYIIDIVQLLADLTGMIYFVSGDNVMFFDVRDSSVYSSFSLTDADYRAVSLKVKRSRERYRNVQYLRGGLDLTDPRVETFVGDTERQTFNTAYPVGVEPTIAVNGTPKTVGIRGVEEGKQWYWNAGMTEVSQENDDPPLSASDTLSITYQGQFPVIAEARDEAQIVSRMSVEGGSGLYESVEIQSSINDSDMALAFAVARLEERGFIPITVEVVTHESGIKAGMLVAINLTNDRLNGDFLVSEVKASCVFGDIFLYTLTLLDGSGVGGWDKFFRKLVQQQGLRTTNADETVLLLRLFGEVVTLTDAVVVSAPAAPETRIGYLEIGYGEIG